MSIIQAKSDQQLEVDKTRRNVFLAAGAAAVLLIGGLIIYLATRPTPVATAPADTRLDGGIRAGMAEFEEMRDLIQFDTPIAEYSSSVSGGMQMTIATTVRNFTGSTIVGLEMKAGLTDLDGNLIKERTMVVIPSRNVQELLNNDIARAPVTLLDFSKEDQRRIEGGSARIEMEVTAVKLK